MRLLRRINPEIAFGFLIATVVWAAVLGWQASYALPEIQKQECYQAAKKSDQKSDECKSFWEKTTSDPIALFTLVLAFSTIGLWVATGALYLAGERQRRLAERTSERQLRAYIHVFDVKMSHIDDEWSPVIRINIKNFGQTPAIRVKHTIGNTLVIAGPGSFELRVGTHKMIPSALSL